MTKIRVLLVEDHDVVREGLRALLQTSTDIEVVGDARDGAEAVKAVRQTEPDVVLMDISMPVLNGLEATRQILKIVRDAKILVLSSYDDPDCVEEMMASGVKGFLSKRSAAVQVADAIRTVRAGKTFYSPEVVKRVREQQNARPLRARDPKNPFALTDREREVLQLIAEGFPNKGIASELGISIKTVEKHRQGAMNKLNIHEVAGLTRYALSRGIVSEKLSPRKPGAEQPAEAGAPGNPGGGDSAVPS